MIDGKTIAITRSKDDSEEFIELITQQNANPITLPTIELITKGEKIVDEFLETIEKENPDYSVFMSSKAVTLLIDSAKKNFQIPSVTASHCKYNCNCSWPKDQRCIRGRKY